MLPLCSGFHDQLWAHLKVLVDQQVESELCDSMLPGAYWKHNLSLEEVIETLGWYRLIFCLNSDTYILNYFNCMIHESSYNL